MGRPPKVQSLIPLSPPRYIGSLSTKEQQCAVWHVISKCTQVEAYVLFQHPELATTPALAQRLAREFFGSREVIEFSEQYEGMLRNMLGSGSVSDDTAPPKPKAEPKPRLVGESEDDYKKRRKREAAEAVVEKIIDRVDEVEDIDGLLDTIKAMKDTKFFDDESSGQKPPIRYLPETCSSCEYKRFIDEQIKKGNVMSY